MNPNTVNIIVIGYNLKELEQACLSSIIKNTRHPYMITYFDNYESGFTLTEIWNLLISKSIFDFQCLINNDCYVHPGWLEKLMETMLSHKSIGFCGPSTNQCHSPQMGISTHREALLHAGETEVMVQPISGFCLLFRKSLWKLLGKFDERYTLYGQESDLMNKAQNQGYKCVWRKDAFVWHQGEASVKASGLDVEKEREKAKAIYWRRRREPCG